MENFDNQIVEETVQNTPNAPHSFNDNEKDLMTQACTYLYSISKWMKFFFVLMIIAIVFMVVCGIMFVSASSMLGSEFPFPAWIMGVLYLVLAVLYVIPAVYMKRIFKSAENTIISNDNEAMVEFLKNNKSLWKFFGILTIVLFGLSILVLPVAIALTSLA